MHHLRTVAKAVVSLGLLGYLIYLAGPEQILAVFSKIWYDGGIVFIFLAAGLFLFSLLLLSLRWQLLVSGYGLNISTRQLFKFYLIGLFFNNFLPTGIGGDVLRIYNLIQESGNRTISFASVLTERLLGISSTLLLTIISLIVLYNQIKSHLLLIIAFAMMFAVILFFYIAFNKRLVDPIDTLCQKITIFRLGERIKKFFDAIRFYSNSKQIFFKILLVSLLSQIVIILKTFVLSLALGLNLNLGYLFFVVPITFLLTMLPSINGIGFRDGGYVILLARVGVDKASALSLSFLTLLIPMLISIAGAILFMLQKKIIREEEVDIVEKSI